MNVEKFVALLVHSQAVKTLSVARTCDYVLQMTNVGRYAVCSKSCGDFKFGVYAGLLEPR